jgi:tRNA U34 5-methylaminomethyl-2-thiouridine-forming methyltransferase MnmC
MTDKVTGIDPLEHLTQVPTGDGSITCLDQTTGELYHNRAGAYTEALRNYVEPCDIETLLSRQNEITVLDVCFGLGYNTFVLLVGLLGMLDRVGARQPVNLKVVAIDRDQAIIDILPIVLSDSRLAPVAQLAQDFCEFGALRASRSAPPYFVCHRLLGEQSLLSLELLIKFVDLRDEIPKLLARTERFDFIFHDGFSPRKMPELWSYDLFSHYAKLLKEEGKILTYSSASAVRGALRLCGLTVMRTASVGGKSGGTIAARTGVLACNKFAQPLLDGEESRLQSRSSIPYRDPHLIERRETILSRRENEMRASDLPIFKND